MPVRGLGVDSYTSEMRGSETQHIPIIQSLMPVRGLGVDSYTSEMRGSETQHIPIIQHERVGTSQPPPCGITDCRDFGLDGDFIEHQS